MPMQLFDSQTALAKRVRDQFDAGQQTCLIEATPGYGKTMLVAATLKDPAEKTLCMYVAKDAEAYVHRGASPGPLSPVYSIFRDRILLVALTEIRTEFMESMGHDTDSLEPLRYVMKRTTRTDGVTCSPRAVLGWESV